MRVSLAFLVAAAVMSLSGAAWAQALNQPGYISNQTAHLIDVFEGADGGEVGPVVTLSPTGGFHITDGWLVLLEQGLDPAPPNWSDVVLFSQDTVQLFSDPIDPILISQVTGNVAYIPEVFDAGVSGIKWWPTGARGNGSYTYSIHSDVSETHDTDVPEAGSLLLGITGLGPVVAFARLRRRH